MTAPTTAADLADLERERLRCLVEARSDDADSLHAPDFQIVTPSGGVWNKEQYLGGIADGSIDYRRFEPTSDIDVMVDEHVAVLRYRSAIDIAVSGQEPGPLECWHLDCYERDNHGAWRVRWSQATEILRRRPERE
ncbi:nuclear transport factor 2 family protein [Kineosporia sp. A_224]|uniref:nuclear transport factor 2 family protein n=1 Tax=Kineosporia sp. A_224 TaxID=1962180 RepID=UPI00130455A2|nr:nuclear transport factor 2 family protein [Kineosporia sp. A_224]